MVCTNYINRESRMRLICAVYFTKYEQFFRKKYTHLCLSTRTLKRTSNYLHGLDTPMGIQLPLTEWHTFIQKVTYHVSKLLPSWEALENHRKRSVYVLKLVYCINSPHCPYINKDICETHSWKVGNEGIAVEWTQTVITDPAKESRCSCSGEWENA